MDNTDDIDGHWYDRLWLNCEEKKRICPGVDRIEHPICIAVKDSKSAVITELYCSAEVLTIRSDYFKDLIPKVVGEQRKITFVDDDPSAAATFIEEIHKLCSDDIKKGLRWNKEWAERAVKWHCTDFISAYKNFIPKRLNDICRLEWIDLKKTPFKEKPLALVGCEIENWHHQPFQHVGSRCHGIITAALSSVTFYIQNIGTDMTQKFNLGSAPDNCRVLMRARDRSQKEVQEFWELVETLLTYTELQKADDELGEEPSRSPGPVIIRSSRDVAELLSSSRQWDLWHRPCMRRLLNPDDLLDICEDVRRFGEPWPGALSPVPECGSGVSDDEHKLRRLTGHKAL